MTQRILQEEKKLRKKGYKKVACLDEAGRGCLAGPVVVSAVVITTANIENQKSKIKNILKEVKDSKKLSARKREELYEILTKHHQIEWAIGRISEKVIDKINILEATKWAMKMAVKRLERKLKESQNNIFSNGRRKRCYQEAGVDFLILDGKLTLDLPIAQKSIIKADEKIVSCQIASIIAKVTRDRIMKRYHLKYPKYRFDKHKGYPTKLHLKMMRKYSFCEIHRRSFKPVKKIKKVQR